MRRVVVIAAVAVPMLTASVGTAGAASVQRYAFRGTVAQAYWVVEGATTVVHVDVAVSRNRLGRVLTVFETIDRYDPSGHFTGSSSVVADAHAGFTMSIDASLSSARASGDDVPATTCSYDANYQPLGCSPSTIDVTAQWTGIGPVDRSHSTAHFHSAGFTSVYHDNGSARDAIATGSVDNVALTRADLVTARLSADTNGFVEVCPAPSC